jgi:cell division control protein 6
MQFNMSRSFERGSQIFEDERPLTDDWDPEELPERDEELGQIHNALAPAIRDTGVGPHNMFLFGKTGQGKTAGVEYKLEDLEQAADDAGLDVTTIQYNCAGDSSSYHVLINLVELLIGENLNGHPMSKITGEFFEAVTDIGGTVIVVLDEIDNIGTSDEILYSIPRAKSNDNIPKEMHLSVIGISNNFKFRDNLSPKVKDTLFDEEIHFAPYDANQLCSILERRADQAFKQDVLEEGVISLCAANAAQDKGSARQALRYLYKAGELASNTGDDKVTEDHVRTAQERIDRKNIEKGIREMTMQDQLSLTAVVALEVAGKNPAKTTELYAQYKDIAAEIDADIRTQRSMRDHLLELDLMGVVDATKKQTGNRGGPHYVFEMASDLGMTLDILSEDSRIGDAIDLVTTNRTIDEYVN